MTADIGVPPLLSLSGHPLKGWKPVKQVYLDEAGIGSLKDEPVLVVVGVMVDPDQNWRLIESRLRALARQHFPGLHDYFFRFHAKDVFHGTGLFPRSSWPREKRWDLLKQLVSLPAEIHLPVIAAGVNRQSVRDAGARAHEGGVPEFTERELLD